MISLLQEEMTPDLVNFFQQFKKEQGWLDRRAPATWQDELQLVANQWGPLNEATAKIFQVISVLEELSVRGVKKV